MIYQRKLKKGGEGGWGLFLLMEAVRTILEAWNMFLTVGWAVVWPV